MTAHRDLKNIIRERQEKTGESYAAARVHVMRERAERLGLEPEDAPATAPPERADAVVLKVNQRSARLRILGEGGEVTFRSGDVFRIVPGHVVSLVIDRRWTWGGDAYASGKIENARIDVATLGLEPLVLEGGELDDLSPYDELDSEVTARPSFEYPGLAWGQLPGVEGDESPVADAADLAAEGDPLAARELLMDVLGADLRCLDAHAHLGNLTFERMPERAVVHYEIGMRIGELSLPAGFDGFLLWGRLFNRPFLRCLHGYGLCLWRLGKSEEAGRIFERMLSLNPIDNQGVRFCLEALRAGRSWEDMQRDEDEESGPAGVH